MCVCRGDGVFMYTMLYVGLCATECVSGTCVVGGGTVNVSL